MKVEHAGTAGEARSEAVIDRFRDLVSRSLGLHFDDWKRADLAEVLVQRARDTGCDGADAYLGRLAGGWREEVGALAERFTVTETYFFRNPDQFQALEQVALPHWSHSGRRQLRLLSAGCASGEEAYSLAIVVRDLGLHAPEQVRIQGVDLNPAMIDKAARARYSEWSLRATPPEIRARCFRPSGKDLDLEAGVRAMASFELRNLIEDAPAFWQPETFDVIFCRNVIMYFAPITAGAVVARLARSLAPGGFLFLGHAETLRGLSQDFHLRHTHGTFYYQRREGSRPHAGSGAPAATQALPAAPIHNMVEASDSWVEAIQRASDRIEVLARQRGAQPAPAPTETTDPEARPAQGPARPGGWGLAMELLRAERFREALELLRALPPESQADPDVQLLHAVLLTNAGDLADAEALCLELLEQDELNAGAHYLVALCREHAGDRRAAIEHDQTAAYLDPCFAMPRLHLGLLAKRAGDPETARRELGQALSLLAHEDAARILLLGGGFSRPALVELCRAELQGCGGAP